MVEGVAEVLRLVLSLRVVVFAVMLLTEVLRHAVAQRVAVAVVAVAGTVAIALSALATLTTLTALGALAALTLLIALGLRDEHTVRQLVLAGLGVDLKQLHRNLVAFLQSGFLDGLETLPVDLRDMEQTILARHDLYRKA